MALPKLLLEASAVGIILASGSAALGQAAASSNGPASRAARSTCHRAVLRCIPLPREFNAPISLSVTSLPFRAARHPIRLLACNGVFAYHRCGQTRIVILMNEYTRSGAEMVASFAKENRLATLVGTQTAREVPALFYLPPTPSSPPLVHRSKMTVVREPGLHKVGKQIPSRMPKTNQSLSR